MSKRFSDPFTQQYRTPDRDGDAAAIEAFLQKGGKVTRLRDSREAEVILEKRRRRMTATTKSMPAGGLPLTTDTDAITVSED